MIESYISTNTICQAYPNSKLKLKDMLQETIDNAKEEYNLGQINITYILQSIGFINNFCDNNNFKKIKLDYSRSNKGSYCYEMIQNYQSEFLVENIDLYNEYFNSYKYEFKPEKLEEIKKLVLELKTDIKEENTLSEEEQDDIIAIIDEVDKSLIVKTNDIDTVNGKLFRLKMTLNNLGVVTGKVNDKINTVFSKVNDVDTFISNVQSIYNKVDGLITNLGRYLLGS